MKLNVYLFKNDVTDFRQCLLSKTDKRQYEAIHPTKTRTTFQYEVYLIRGRETQPTWLSFLSNYVEEDAISNLTNQSNSAVILLKVKIDNTDRYFALSYGFGYHILDKEKIEPNFGLKTTLNTVNPTGLRSIDTKNVEVQTIQKKQASNLETGIADFGFDFDSEILKIVSGVCNDDSIGTRIGGSDNLHLNSDITFSELGAKCETLYSHFKKDTYKGVGFDFIDSMRFITDPSQIRELDEILVNGINNRQDDYKISLAYPDQIDYERCSYYQIKCLGREETIIDVRLQDIYELLGKTIVDIDDIKKKIRITGYDDETNSPCTHSESLYKYLTFETDYNDKRYVITGSKWYCIDKDFIKRVEDYLVANLMPYDTNKLLVWDTDKNEGEYNDLYKSMNEYLYLDRQLFSRGYGKIEIADLYFHTECKLYCIKKLSGSSTLSHLFAQGSVSAELFKEETTYRDCFLERLRNKWNNETFDQSNIDKLVFVYAIGTEKSDDLIKLLPLFSKINLRKHARMITNMGYKLQLAKIQMVNSAKSNVTKP